MPRNKNRPLIIGATAVIIIAISIGIGAYVFTQRAPATITVPTTSTILVDGITGKELDKSDFTGTIYETNNIKDWIDFDVVKNLTAVSITDSDLSDVEKDIIILRIWNGTVLHDEDLFDRDLGPRFYGEHWFIITAGIKNELKVYQQPSSAGISVVDAESFSPVNTSAVTAGTNVSITISTNLTETDAMYINQMDYEDGIELTINILVEFNDTIATSVFSISGLEKSRFNTTALEFSVTESLALGGRNSPRNFFGYWDDDLAIGSVNITGFTLRYGDNAI